MRPRLAFLTIGQTPRVDLVPEIVGALPVAVDVEELGALDGLSATEIEALAPGADDDRLVTRLRDGAQTVVRKASVQPRLQRILDTLDPEAYAAVVLLCTGDFPGLTARGLFLDAQHLVDHGVEAVAARARRVGVVVPLPEQVATFHYRPGGGQEVVFDAGSPYVDGSLEGVGQRLRACDLVVMHCMGYTEEQRRRVADASGRPVLLARRQVAASLAQLL